MMKKILFLALFFLILSPAPDASAHQPVLMYLQKSDFEIKNPELSRAFYDELYGKPRNYFIDSNKDFRLYLNLLTPDPENRNGRYSAKVFLVGDDKFEKQILTLDGLTSDWQEYYEEFGRDYYLKGPELDQALPAGRYKIEVFSANNAENRGKYVLAVGKTESFDAKSVLNAYWQLPLLKVQFFKTSVVQFFLTPFGIGLAGALGAILILLSVIYYIIGAIKQAIKHSQAKTLFLASNPSNMKEEILALLQKPSYDIMVGFITTAYKYKFEENPDYVNKDLEWLKTEMRFNVEEFDIEGKSERQIFEFLRLQDIIWVEGGNTFYLLKAMRQCNFEKVVRKLLKLGKVYVGVSAGSIVAGKNIKTAGWFGDDNFVKLRNLKGLNLVPFDIFVHYQPEYAEIIKKKLPWKWQRRKLKILTDEQAILVQGKEVDEIGEGPQIVI